MNPAYDLLNCKQHSHQISFLFRAWCNAILFLLLIIHYLLLKKLVGLCFPLLMSDTSNVLLNTFKGNQYHFHIIQISANNWGKCLGGGKAVGCGPQETFRNCADVQIYSNAVGLPPTAINHPNTIYSIDETAPGDEKPTTTLWVKSKRSKIVSFFGGILFISAIRSACLPSCILVTLEWRNGVSKTVKKTLLAAQGQSAPAGKFNLTKWIFPQKNQIILWVRGWCQNGNGLLNETENSDFEADPWIPPTKK